MAANDLGRYYGTEVALETAGATHNNNVLSTLTTNALDLTTGADSNMPHAEFVLEVVLASAPSAPGFIELVVQELGINASAHDAPAPDNVYRPGRRAFYVKNIATVQRVPLRVLWVPKKAKYAIFPNALGVNVTSWKLWATPFTTRPKAS